MHQMERYFEGHVSDWYNVFLVLGGDHGDYPQNHNFVPLAGGLDAMCRAREWPSEMLSSDTADETNPQVLSLSQYRMLCRRKHQ